MGREGTRDRGGSRGKKRKATACEREYEQGQDRAKQRLQEDHAVQEILLIPRALDHRAQQARVARRERCAGPRRHIGRRRFVPGVDAESVKIGGGHEAPAGVRTKRTIDFGMRVVDEAKAERSRNQGDREEDHSSILEKRGPRPGIASNLSQPEHTTEQAAGVRTRLLDVSERAESFEVSFVEAGRYLGCIQLNAAFEVRRHARRVGVARDEGEQRAAARIIRKPGI